MVQVGVARLGSRLDLGVGEVHGMEGQANSSS